MKEKTLLKWALAGSIVIVLNLFFNYGLSVFYSAPVWDDFCGDVSAREILTETMCIDEGGKWFDYGERGEMSRPTMVESEVERTGYCDAYFTCGEAFNEAHDEYSRNAFIVLLVLGIASLLLGTLLVMPPVVSLGLSFGGALSLVIASMRYWGSADDIIRLLILALALAALIFVGVRKFKD